MKLSRSDVPARIPRRSGRSSVLVATLFATAALAVAGPATHAAEPQVSIDSYSTVDRGHYYRQDADPSNVHHSPNIETIPTGHDWSTSYGFEYRSFFLFDLPGTTEPVVKAELKISVHELYGYSSPDATETLTLFDVTSDLDDLVAGGTGLPGLPAIFEDLGSGAEYGSMTMSNADEGDIVTVVLGSGVRNLAQAGGEFAIGGALTSLTPAAGETERIFAGSFAEYGAWIELTLASHKPDGRIRKGSGPFVGDDIYNKNAAGQTRSGSAPRGGTVTYTISIQNDGAADRFTVQGGGSTASFKVTYWNGLIDITAAVGNGSFQTTTLGPGVEMWITQKVKVKPAAPAGATLVRKITIGSVGDPAVVDTVQSTTKRS